MAIDVVVQREESFLASYGYPDPNQQFLILVGITVIIWVLESLFEYWWGILWRNLAQTAQHELRMDAYNHIQNLEMQWFSEQSTGGLMSILNDDVNQLERFLDQGANDLLQLATTITVVGSIMFILAPEVALLAVIPVPILLWKINEPMTIIGTGITANKATSGAKINIILPTTVIVVASCSKSLAP
jgi:ATP-binding cassette subfamily B protein